MNVKQSRYHWGIVAASAIILAFALGMLHSSNSLFVKPICEKFGFARAEYTLNRTIITIISALLFPLYGRLNIRYGTKRLLLVSTIFICASMLCLSFVTALWQIYLISAVYGLFYNGPSFLVIGLLINEWFAEKRGTAVGIACAGSGLGGAVLVPITEKVIAAFGWRNGYIFIALLAAVVIIPVVLLFIKNKPSDVGLMPYGIKNTDTVTEEKVGPTLKEALHGPLFWLVLVSMVLLSVVAAGSNTHMTPYLTDIGYASQYAASVFSTMMLSLVVGKIGLGVIYDRFGSMVGNLVIGLTGIIGSVFAIVAYQPVAAFGFAIFYGISTSGVSTAVAILASRYFGNRSYTDIYSLLSMSISLGSAVGVPALAAIFDITGSYVGAWKLLLLFTAVMSVMLVLAELGHSKQVKNEHANNKTV